MRVELKPVNVTLSDKTKEYAQQKAKKLGRFWDQVTDTIIYFKKHNSHHHSNLIEVKTLVPDNTLIIEERGGSFEEALDLAIERMIRQIKRVKQKQYAR